MKIINPIITLILFSFLAVSCVEGSRVLLAPDYENADPAIGIPTRGYTPEASTPEPTATLPVLRVDNEPYMLESNALIFQPPANWLLVKSLDYYVKFTDRDNIAWFEAAYETTGYELESEQFVQYCDNVIHSLYSRNPDFEILEETLDGVRRTVISSYSIAGVEWKSMDAFIQREEVVYMLSFHTPAFMWESMVPGFVGVYESVVTQRGYVGEENLYAFVGPYVSPANIFSFQRKPLSWQVTSEESGDDRTTIENIKPPDGHAVVQTVIYLPDVELSPANIGQTAIGKLRELHNEDLKIVDDYVLMDGRVRLDWVSADSNQAGFSFFWLNEYDLILLTFKYDGDYEHIYQQVLFRIGDSFGYTGGN